MLFVTTSSPYWVDTIINVVTIVATLVGLGLAIWAFFSIVTQRGDAFAAVGTLSKPGWLALVAGTTIFSLILPWFGYLLALASLVASLVYLLDVRPAIREILGGR